MASPEREPIDLDFDTAAAVPDPSNDCDDCDDEQPPPLFPADFCPHCGRLELEPPPRLCQLACTAVQASGGVCPLCPHCDQIDALVQAFVAAGL